MTADEICMSFRLAKRKGEQIRILADLTASDEETVIEVLKDHKLWVEVGKCKRCKALFWRYLSPYCPVCDAARKTIMWGLEVNADALRYHSSEIRRLNAERERLEERLNEN